MRKTLSVFLLFFTLAVYTPTILSCQTGSVTADTQHLGNPSVKVWVNTASGVYHCPGTRWYGNTKQGEYMTQKQARDQGNRPAYGKVCE